MKGNIQVKIRSISFPWTRAVAAESNVFVCLFCSTEADETIYCYKK